MSDLSAKGTTELNTMDVQNHASSMPKCLPIRVKELLNFYGSDDDDESEDKAEDSDTESDVDEPQPLPDDDSIDNTLNESLSDANYDNRLQPTTSEVSLASTVSKTTNPLSVYNNVESKPDSAKVHVSVQSNFHNVDSYDSKYKDIKHDSYRSTRSVEINNDKKCGSNTSQPSHAQSNCESAYAQERVSQNEHKSKHMVNVDINRQSSKEQTCKSNAQSIDKYNKGNSNELDSIAYRSQHFRNVHQPGSCTLQNTNVDTVDSKATDNISSNKLGALENGTLVNSMDHLALQTPLKHPPCSSRPEPCFSRRNMVQTPQSKPFDMSRSLGLTPATVSCRMSVNNTRQTPLQNKNVRIKETAQTPTNSVYFTPSMTNRETSRYVNSETKRKQPLADAGSYILNNASNSRVLQGYQLPKVKEETPNVENQILNKNLPRKINVNERILAASENPAQFELESNEQLKENKYPDKEAKVQKPIRSSTHVSRSTKNVSDAPKQLSNDSQNQYLAVNNQNQQPEPKRSAETAPNVQFSIPPNTPKPTQSKTIFVKGKEYLILGSLGQGMSGEVLRVQDLSTLVLCAIKCVNLSRMDRESAQGCLEEISMLHKLQAPCIVRMFDYEIRYNMVYVVMEMGDTDLSRLLKTISQEGHISLTMVLYYWTEMLTAVKHIHDNGVIHSDLKPANFLLVRGRLKLIDFGIASNMNADMTSVVKNCPIGTLNYISPEALMDSGESSGSPMENVKYKITFKSDVWSLGCILYSLVYGHTPFQHIRSQWAKVNAITNPKLNISFPATLTSREGDNKVAAPTILIDVMRKCLQHDPKARPTVAELLQVDYVPTNQERLLQPVPDIPANILVKIKYALNEDEWRQLTRVLENKRYP